MLTTPLAALSGRRADQLSIFLGRVGAHGQLIDQ
jgi:hypothetical protein